MKGMSMWTGIVIIANVVHYSHLADWGFWIDAGGLLVGGIFILVAMKKEE